jgi:hypothetical protein
MCFLWISEQTAIISLNNINWLVCITETECVYCAARTGSLTIIPVNFSLVRQCRGLSPRRPRFDPTAVNVRRVVDKVVLANVYFPSTSAVPFRYHSTNAQYSVGIILPMLSTHYHLHFALTTRTNKWSLRTFYKSMLFRKPGSAGDIKLVFLPQLWLHFRHILIAVGWQCYGYNPPKPSLSVTFWTSWFLHIRRYRSLTIPNVFAWSVTLIARRTKQHTRCWNVSVLRLSYEPNRRAATGGVVCAGA